MPEAKASPKSCFVIGRVGEPDTEERRHADDLTDFIITPAALAVGIAGENVKRADRLSSSGVITNEIVDHLVKSDIVVADLTGHNANVFYELAIRHVIRKPFVHMIALGERIPFDVGATRAIRFDIHDLRSAQAARIALETTMREEMAKSAQDIVSPFTMGLDLTISLRSTDKSDPSTADIVRAISRIERTIIEIGREVRREPFSGTSASVRPNSLRYLVRRQNELRDYRETLRRMMEQFGSEDSEDPKMKLQLEHSFHLATEELRALENEIAHLSDESRATR